MIDVICISWTFLYFFIYEELIRKTGLFSFQNSKNTWFIGSLATNEEQNKTQISYFSSHIIIIEEDEFSFSKQ